MAYARHVARFGALAVTLSVGAALATMPAVAIAEPTDSGSSSPSNPGPGGAGAPAGEADGAKESAPGPNAPPDSTKFSEADADVDAVDTAAEEAGEESAFGGDENELAAATLGDENVVPAAGEAGTLPVNQEGADPPVTGDDSSIAESDGQPVGHRARTFSQPDAFADVQSTDGTEKPSPTTQSTELLRTGTAAEEPALHTVALAAPLATSSTRTPPVAVVTPPRPTFADILEEPHTFLVNVTAHLVNSVLQALLAPLGPGSPAQSPVLWALLAYVRDEFRRILLPHTSPTPASPTLLQAPNLLVNPGAEIGDPSLSGYSAVTVPGWTLAGTPTVIEYDTPRRFPVPTPSPGPVLPNLLAFPGHGGAIPIPPDSGRQFFGGGPVADSALRQHVDLSAAADAIDNRSGGVQYELSGDLGGFLIDPSRAKVTVTFLNQNGVALGTGSLKPVTAWDRLFATGLLHRRTVGTIPVGTRAAQVVVSFDDRNPVLGNYNNAYADNLSFKVDADGLSAAPLIRPDSTVGQLDHVFMVYLENKGVSQIVGSPNAPYLNLLIDNYGYASNYYGLTHPSDPNYYPIIGGSDFGINYNCPSNCFPAGTPTLVQRLDEVGKTWAGYAEGGGGYSTPTDRLPFLAFSDIYNDPQLVATHLFDISQLQQGLADPTTAPNFVWFAADDATNMEGPTDFPIGILRWVLGFLSPAHQYNVKAGDDWLQGPLTTIFNSPTWQDPARRSAIFITFDEDYNNLSTGVGNEGNHIVTIVIPSAGAVADGMRSGSFVADDHYNHYSLLRTIEDSLGLAPVTNNDRYAVPMNGFWEVKAA